MTATIDRVDSPGTGSGVVTVASRVRDWAQQDPNGVAMREKDFGIWQEYSWSELWDDIVTAGHGLLALGVGVGDVVSIHSEDRPEWVILDLATVAIRGINTGLYPTNPYAEVKYLVNDSGARVHFAEDQEQVDKVLDAPRSEFPKVEKILYVEPRGVRTYDDDRLVFWDDFMELGRQHREANEGAVEALMAEATDGSSEYVTADDEIDAKIATLYDRLSHPVLTNVAVDCGELRTHSVYPKKLPALFKGSEFMLFSRYREGGTHTFTVSGSLSEGVPRPLPGSSEAP